MLSNVCVEPALKYLKIKKRHKIEDYKTFKVRNSIKIFVILETRLTIGTEIIIICTNVKLHIIPSQSLVETNITLKLLQ